jgi:Protein involved in formate dehydrogenase formation
MAGSRSGVATSPWAASRRRAAALRDRQPFAADVLTLYLALLDVWEAEYAAVPATAAAQAPEALAGWAAERVLPRVVEATMERGPEPLAKALADVADMAAADLRGAGTELLVAWLTGAELAPVERYLARAALRGPLARLAGADPAAVGAVCANDPAPRGGRRCPRCGGPPQLSFRADAADPLVSGGRRLQCARCAESWGFSSSTCPSCGETVGAKRTIYSEHGERPQVGPYRQQKDGTASATFPHLRIEGCDSCARYLIDVDLGRDPRAVPEVDELAALPLDLYAAERGISKITPNLMGF